MDDELKEKAKEMAKEYEDLLRKNDKTTRVEVLVPHIESLYDLKNCNPLTLVSCKSMISGAFLIMTLETIKDDMYKRHPEIKKIVKKLKRSTTRTETIIE